MSRRGKHETGPGVSDSVEMIVAAAVRGVSRPAGGFRLDPSALESLRRQFLPRARAALARPGWRAHWQRETVYVLAYARVLGARAATLAKQDARMVITRQDIDAAVITMVGYLPVAGRWCPV